MLVAVVVLLATACTGHNSTPAGGTTGPTTPPTEIARTVPAATSALTTTTATTASTAVTTTAPATTTSTPLAVTIGGPVATVTYATAPDTIPVLHDAKYQPIIDAYLAFQDVTFSIAATYPVNPDDPRLSSVMTPEAAARWRSDVYGPVRDRGEYTVAPQGITLRPAVGPDATDTAATVYDCRWTSDYQIDHATAQPTPDMHPTPQPNQRAITDYTVPHVDPIRTELVNRDGRWLVTTSYTDWIATCTDLDK